MQVVSEVEPLRRHLAASPSPIGLVPTMGALHDGHASLVQLARAQCATVVASLFVNPLQFGPAEDLSKYPRDYEGDRERFDRLGVDVLFVPDTAVMYPREPKVTIDPGGPARHFEGARRPGHFRGVATVVLKLFNIVQPARAYFGEKDAQQLAVIRQMVADLNVPVEIVSCPTIRAQDGLALSSRNAYLSDEERRAASHLYRTLCALRDTIASGNGDVARAIEIARRQLAPLKEDYLAVVRPGEFEPLMEASDGAQLLAIGAAFAGKTRLIDNLQVQVPNKQEVSQR